MRRHIVIGLAALVVASGLWATPAVGQELRYDGNELLSYCAEVLDDNTGRFAEAGTCIGFVRGVVWASGFQDTPLYRKVCVPPTSTLGQSVRVVYNWLEDHPERLHEHQGFLIILALQNAWPCSE